jgi:hypothetical protein
MEVRAIDEKTRSIEVVASTDAVDGPAQPIQSTKAARGEAMRKIIERHRHESHDTTRAEAVHS